MPIQVEPKTVQVRKSSFSAPYELKRAYNLPHDFGKTQLFIPGSHFRPMRFDPWASVDVTVALSYHPAITGTRASSLAVSLCEIHPAITVDSNVLAGTPHIKGTRISVAHILADLYHLGSVENVAQKLARITDIENVKAAIAYAHDFMETACDLSEDDD
jgi:uncharacterized protein (DUF433 family)